MKKILKGIVSMLIMLTIMVTSYAFDFDTIFNVKASAATYTEKAHSMFEFYKNGSSLDRTAISDDELYVFGVFVSNFLMPFQSNVGAMSSDAFVTKMCAMFFGDAYTAQQLADMKYTLGLVQTAQNTRSRIVTAYSMSYEGDKVALPRSPISLEMLLSNFGGFTDEFHNSKSPAIVYTWEGAPSNGSDGNYIVWESGSNIFDAILGQVIAVCPSQAGAYIGTAGNMASQLYVDCFGNISDGNGVVIIPACMNPYAFYNKYLDANRQPKTQESLKECPLQLPINNAFWMGTMVDPQELYVRISTKDDAGVTLTLLKQAYVSLPNLYALVDGWSNSATVTIGIDTVTQSSLGIYFSNKIQANFVEAWSVAMGISDLPDGDIAILLELASSFSASGAEDTSDERVMELIDHLSKEGKEFFGITDKDIEEAKKTMGSDDSDEIRVLLTTNAVQRILNRGGLIDVWAFIGGTTVPITSVLDDIVLFDTYSTFSDSLVDSIYKLSMYKDDINGGWWGANTSTGTAVDSVVSHVMRTLADKMPSYNNGSYASTWEKFYNGGQAFSASGLQSHFGYTDKYLIPAAMTILDDCGFDGEYTINEYLDKLVGHTSYSSTDTLSNSLQNLVSAAGVLLSDVALLVDEAGVVPIAFVLRSLLAAATGDSGWLCAVAFPEEATSPEWSWWDYALSVVTLGTYALGRAAGDWIGRSIVNGALDVSNGIKSLTGDTYSGTIMDIAPIVPPGGEAVTTTGSWANTTIADKNGKITGVPIPRLVGAKVYWDMDAQWNTRYFLNLAHPLSLQKTGVDGGLGYHIRKFFADVGGFFSSASKVLLWLSLPAVMSGIKVSNVVSTVSNSRKQNCNSLYAFVAANANNTVDANKGVDKSKVSAVKKDAYGRFKYNMTQLYAFLDGSANAGSSLVSQFYAAYVGESNVDEEQKKLDSVPSTIYVSEYTLYSPYRSLAPSLGAVSKVYTENGIVNGNSISTKVGSYITNDVNMWGGIYYAYMVDILGLHFEGDTMKAAMLSTNFPEVSTSMTNKNKLNLQGLLDAGTEEDAEAAEAEKRRTLMDRLDELTNLTSSEYRNKLMTQTTNSWLVSTHAALCGASESGSTQNIGSGSRYTGYSGYVTTSTLSEMPFTSWVMEYYNIIYTVLMVIIVVLAVCMALTGHRTWRLSILSVLTLAVVLLVPRLSIDTAVAATNNLASDLYKDRFNFWAYSQHLMYLQDLNNTSTEYEFLIVTNMQMAKDYYDSENGVTLKWMSPKKSSYWDALVGTVEIEGADSDYSGLNLSIFTWLFQGYFRQETYSTDPTATYLYRPYLDIVMTASNNSLPVSVGGNGIPVSTLVDTDSSIHRAAYAAYTISGWEVARDGYRADWDIKPAHRQVDASGQASPAYAGNLDAVTSDSSLGGWNGLYVVGLINENVNGISYGNYADKTDASAYATAYPNTADSYGSSGTFGLITANPLESTTNDNLKQFYLYTESPYYYFYYMFKDAAVRYTGEESASALLLSKDFFRYRSSAGDEVAAGNNPKHSVDDDTLMDFLDLEGLFTYVIPYLEQANMYSDEWMAVWGRDVTAATTMTGSNGAVVDTATFTSNLKAMWQIYSPWVDAMYSTTYADGRIRSGGKSYVLEDAINPGYYTDIRPMVFSPADMQRNFVTDADLSEVESRIMSVLENTYIDLMYLNNYTSFDDEVLFSAMAMTATFNFNKEFSDTSLFGENITMYPVGFEVRNFNYDAFLRLSLLNTTGESIFSDADIYTTVIENTSFFTGVLLILNDIVAVYVVPAMKLIVLLALFFLGLLVCMFAFVTPPEGMFKWIGKNYLIPFGIFVGALVGHMLIVSLFVGEGVTTVVGQRGITVTTGDPTITIILMLVVNIVYAFALFQVLRIQLKSFKLSLSGIGVAAFGFVAGAAGFIAGQIKGGFNTLAHGGRTVYRGINRGIQRNKNAEAYAKANAKYGMGAGFGGESGTGDTSGTSGATDSSTGRRTGTEEYDGPQRVQPSANQTSETGGGTSVQDATATAIRDGRMLHSDSQSSETSSQSVSTSTVSQEAKYQARNEATKLANFGLLGAESVEKAGTEQPVGSTSELVTAIRGSGLSEQEKKEYQKKAGQALGQFEAKRRQILQDTQQREGAIRAAGEAELAEARKQMATPDELAAIQRKIDVQVETNGLNARKQISEANAELTQTNVNLRNEARGSAMGQTLQRSDSTDAVKPVTNTNTQSAIRQATAVSLEQPAEPYTPRSTAGEGTKRPQSDGSVEASVPVEKPAANNVAKPPVNSTKSDTSYVPREDKPDTAPRTPKAEPKVRNNGGNS